MGEKRERAGGRDEHLIRLDPTVPNAARMYDYYLGGKNHFEVDREAAEKILQMAPETRDLARANRAFLGRAVRFLVEAGIDQMIDLGTGLPAEGCVHEHAPEARVVYVDNDEVVCAHARALVATESRTRVVHADMRVPEKVLSAPETRELIDLDRPIAVLLLSVLHFVPDDAEAKAIVSAFREVMAPGSYLVLSHGTQGDIEEWVEHEGTEIYRRSASPARLRRPDEVAELFEGFELVEPGLVNVAYWRPDDVVFDWTGAYVIGGVAVRR